MLVRPAGRGRGHVERRPERRVRRAADRRCLWHGGHGRPARAGVRRDADLVSAACRGHDDARVSGAPALAQGVLLPSPSGAEPTELGPGCAVFVDMTGATFLRAIATDGAGAYRGDFPMSGLVASCGHDFVVQGTVFAVDGPLTFGALDRRPAADARRPTR